MLDCYLVYWEASLGGGLAGVMVRHKTVIWGFSIDEDPFCWICGRRILVLGSKRVITSMQLNTVTNVGLQRSGIPNMDPTCLGYMRNPKQDSHL